MYVVGLKIANFFWMGNTDRKWCDITGRYIVGRYIVGRYIVGRYITSYQYNSASEE